MSITTNYGLAGVRERALGLPGELDNTVLLEDGARRLLSADERMAWEIKSAGTSPQRHPWFTKKGN